MKDKAEEFAIPSWIRANIEIEKNWDKFERVQQQAEGGAELVQSWQEVGLLGVITACTNPSLLTAAC